MTIDVKRASAAGVRAVAPGSHRRRSGTDDGERISADRELGGAVAGRCGNGVGRASQHEPSFVERRCLQVVAGGEEQVAPAGGRATMHAGAQRSHGCAGDAERGERPWRRRIRIGRDRE